MKYYCDCIDGMSDPPESFVQQMQFIELTDFIEIIFECPICKRRIKVVR